MDTANYTLSLSQSEHNNLKNDGGDINQFDGFSSAKWLVIFAVEIGNEFIF